MDAAEPPPGLSRWTPRVLALPSPVFPLWIGSGKA